MNKSKIFFFFISFFIYNQSFSQILDDSTKQVYGFKTTKYFLEEDVINNHKKFYTSDTSIAIFHLSNFNQRSYWAYQDLGGLGTACKPIYYSPVEQIGTEIGYLVYKPYAFDAQKVQYFDSKSPYTNMYYIQGGNGQNNLRFTHSQNITKQWNLGFDVNRVNSVKQLAAPKEVNLVDSWAFMLFSNYESKNKKYQIMGNYNHFNQYVIDQGGIRLQASDSSQYFNGVSYEQKLANLTAATTREKWNNFHVYHQYELTKGFHAYQSIDYKILADTYYDTQFSDSTNRLFYKLKPNYKLQQDTIRQFINHNLFETKFGIKGFYKGFNYRLHLRERLFSTKYQWNLTDSTSSITKTNIQNETFVGAWASYYFPDSVRKVFAEAEISLPLKASNLRVEYFSPGIKLGFYYVSSPATLLQNTYFGNVFHWQNDFVNPISINLYGAFDYQFGKFRLQPHANYSFISNHIYFDESAISRQMSSTISVFNAGLGTTFQYRRLLIFNQLAVAVSSDAVIKLPTLSLNTRISYEIIYAKVLHINAGVEVYYKTAYFADNYMPLTQQFFLQNSLSVWGNAVADVFADFKIRRVRVFLKYNNLTNKGFFTTPYTPGLRSGFTLGVNWPLFD